MENNLYYIPTISEFHVGFEFEYKPKVGPWVKVNQNNWMSPSKGMELDFCTEQELLRKFDIIDQCIKREDVRCKFLDQSDIESLGWVNSEKLEFTKDTWILRKFEDGLIIYKDYSNGKFKYPWLYEDSTDKIFEGIIKNKSELIKLQQKLNIK